MIFIVPLFIFLLGDVYSFYIFADSSASSHNALDWNQPSCPSDRVCSCLSRGYRIRCVPTVPRKPFRTVLSSRLPVLVCPARSQPELSWINKKGERGSSNEKELESDLDSLAELVTIASREGFDGVYLSLRSLCLPLSSLRSKTC